MRAVYHVPVTSTEDTTGTMDLLGCHGRVPLCIVVQKQRSSEHFFSIDVCKHFIVAQKVTDCVPCCIMSVSKLSV
jgi:hypothetical protein